MDISFDEFIGLQSGMCAKDLEIAKLRGWVAQLKQECEEWKVLALSREAFDRVKADERCSVIVLPLQRLKKALSSIQDVKLLGAFLMLLQKSLPEDTSAETCKAIADIVPLPQLSTMTVHADGDVHIDSGVKTENHFEPGSKSQVFNGNVNGNFERE